MKYLYLLHPPRRWDVVVFKSPDDPDKEHYQQNFIKRLVGLPGEKLMVLDGDIYIWDTADAKWEIPQKTRVGAGGIVAARVRQRLLPPASPAPSPPQFVQPWKPDGAGWDMSRGRDIRIRQSRRIGTLRFDPNANSTTQTLTDYLVYDAGAGPGMVRRPEAIGSNDDANANPVSDLKLTAFYNRISGDGPSDSNFPGSRMSITPSPPRSPRIRSASFIAPTPVKSPVGRNLFPTSAFAETSRSTSNS